MKPLLSLLIIIQIYFSGNVYSQIMFQKTYGDSINDYGTCIQHSLDGGFIITGYSNSHGAGDNDVFLIKTDSLGVIQWTKTYGGPGDDGGNYVISTADGGYLISGYSASFGAIQRDAYVIKTDSLGLVNWSKTYPNSYAEGKSVQQTADSGFIFLVANMLIKTDINGSLLWAKSYSLTLGSIGIKHFNKLNDGYILTGNIFNPAGSSIILIKIDFSGNPIFANQYYDGTPIDISSGYGYYVIQTRDGGFVVTGSDHRSSNNTDGTYLLKTDSVGNFLELKVLNASGHDVGYCVQEDPLGNIIISGRTYNGWSDDIYLIKSDENGNLLWTKAIGDHFGDDLGVSLLTEKDLGYVICGFTFTSSISVLPDVYLEKCDSSGNGCYTSSLNTQVSTYPVSVIPISVNALPAFPVDSNPQTITNSGGIENILCFSTGISNDNIISENSIHFYPNPSSGEFSILFNDLWQDVAIKIFDFFGKPVTFQMYGREIKIVEPFRDGVYIIELIKNNSLIRKKILLFQD